jgi:hypothetical protein
VTKAEVTQSKKGNDMIEVTVQVVGDDPDRGLDVPWNYFVIKDNALWKLAEFCRALHPKVEMFNPRDQQEVTRQLMGRVAVGVVVQKESTYNGETKMKTEVDSWSYPNEKVIATLGDPTIAPSPNVPSAPTATGAPTDDIPF